jgi:exonuclease VII large subunit
MRLRFALLLAVSVVAAAAAPSYAHHSFSAEFDAAKPVTVKGTVARIELTNPHTHVYIDVKDDRGATMTWKFELASPRVLAQLGWRPALIHVGDEVTVEGSMAKDGSSSGNARAVTFANGQRVSAGSSGGDTAPQR